ncbi:MAG: carbon-nitrogen hydrolase family protein, partial [Deltaproteobacteria bacterium]|nr:carbon-nitrogen hydrolase family protein [Deltaproteobacteria bacterium]
MTRETLRIALLHMDVEYHNRGRNLAVLLDLVSRAASLGAKIICAPEMCLTGYVQKSLTAISNLAETDDGPAQAALSAAAMASGAFVAAGWAEKSESGVLYNASRVFAPDGTTVCRYKKINAESRWAAPGPNRQYNIFQTPWGAVGVLICADSYHSLLCRITAMRGASLILLPSNWPDDLWSFPELLWRQRAYE